MEILRKTFWPILTVVLAVACSDPLPFEQDAVLGSEWVIEEIQVNFQLPEKVYSEDETGEVIEYDVPNSVQSIEVLYQRGGGVFVNDQDYSAEYDLDDAYYLTLAPEGLYELEVHDEFDSLNLLEEIFQHAATYYIEDGLPSEYIDEEYGDGDFLYYFQYYTAYLEYSYFSSGFVGQVPQGIWEFVNGGNQIIFDFKDPLYDEGLNLWDVEWLDDQTLQLTQRDQTSFIQLEYYEESEYDLSGEYDSYDYSIYYSDYAQIESASILLMLR